MNDNLTCGLVRDLLPSYVEKLTSEETNEAVERHLAGCPRCAALLEELRRGEEKEEQAEPREVEYLKKVRRSGKRRVALTALVMVLLAVLGVAVKTFLIGEPASAAGMSWTVSQEGDALDLRISATDSAMAYCHWTVENQEGVVFVRGRKVLASPLYRSGEYRTRVVLEGVNQVCLGEQLIWQEGMVISSQAFDLFQARTPYVGDAAALGRVADALGLDDQRWAFTTELQTSRYPYRWTIRFQNHWGDNSADRIMREYYGPLMLALVENLDEVGWTYTTATSGGKTYCEGVLTREEANALVIERTESYNPLHGTSWSAMDGVRDYARSPADLQRLLLLLVSAA